VSILETCRSIENDRLGGAFIEAGCALGGSSILISRQKNKDRLLFIYDVFGLIPAPTEPDPIDVHDRYKIIENKLSEGIEGDKYYGYESNLLDMVKSNFSAFDVSCADSNVSFIKGLVDDTMEISRPVAFAHIDVDWYEPVMTCLKQIYPNLVINGSIILDDYYYWGGYKKAVDEYFRDITNEVSLDSTSGALKITKIK